MRTLARLLLGILVIAVAVPFVLPLRDGKPLLDYRRIRLPDLPELSLPRPGPEGDAAAAVTFYKWRDTDGGWQFDSNPPAPGIPFEIITVDPGANAIQGINAAPPEVESPAAAAPPTLTETYSPEDIQEVLGKAREVQSLMNRRAEEQASVLRVD